MKNQEFKEQDTEKEVVDQTAAQQEEQSAEQECSAGADNVADQEADGGDKTSDVAEAANEWQDKYLRLSAEFDNFRKRTSREKLELRSAGCEDIIKALLPVADDFDRAAQAMQSAQDMDSLRQGMELIIKKFFDTLRAKGVGEIECVGEELDTDFHEAVAKFPVEEADKKGRIIDIAQKGYKFNDKVIRHAKVVVGE